MSGEVAAMPLPPQAIPMGVMPTPPCPKPKERNPNKVMVCMALEENMSCETSLFWEEVGRQLVPGVEFVRNRLRGYGLPKVRSALTWLAIKSDCGKMVMVDSDMKANIPMLARLISHNEAAVSGYYPKKLITRLEWVGNFAKVPQREDGLRECLDFGAGFCCIDLNALDRLIEIVHEETWFVCEDAPWKGQIMWDLWSNGRVVDDWYGKTFPRFLTEDFYLTWRLRKQLGVKVYMDANCQVGHIGTYDTLEIHHRLLELENQSIHRAST